MRYYFKNRKKTIISSIVVLILVGGFVALKYFHKQYSANTITNNSSSNYSVQVKNIDNLKKEIWVWDNRPEVGIGMHHIHDRLAPLQRIHNELGMRVVRVPLCWSDFEKDTEEGNYYQGAINWYDHWYNLAQQNGIELDFVVTTDLAKGHQPPGISYANKEESYERFAQFMTFLVNRYPKVKYWELFNEMATWWTDIFGANTTDPSNLTSPINMYERGKLYTQMLKLAYPAIKTSNLDTLVLMGSTGTNSDFFKGIYDSGGKNYFDILNVHIYDLPLKDALTSKGEQVRSLVDSYGDQGKPIWLTEFGVNAGRIQKVLGYPRLWNTPSDISQDPPECQWSDLPKNANGKLIYDGDGFDYQQCKELRQAIEIAKSSKIYQKTLIFHYIAGNEWSCSYYSKINDATCGAVLKEGTTLNDYGFGIVRRKIDEFVPRPSYNWLKAAQVNSEINNRQTYITDITLSDVSGFVPRGYKYYIDSNSNMIIQNVTVDSLLPTKIVLNKKVPDNPITTINFSSSPNDNGYYNTAPTLTLTVKNVSGALIHKTYYKWDDATSYTTYNPDQLPVANLKGTHTFYFYSGGDYSNVEKTKSLVIKFDPTRPTGSIKINNGAYSTRSRYVTLYLKATDTGGSGVKYMQFSNNGKKWSGWKTYKTKYKNWNMASKKYGGSKKKGTKKVYVQFRDRAGNISKKYYDTIKLK